MAFSLKDITLPYEFVFVFIWCFIGAVLSEKSWKSMEFGKNIKRGNNHIGSPELLGEPDLKAGASQNPLHTITDFLHVVMHTQIYLIKFIDMGMGSLIWAIIQY